MFRLRSVDATGYAANPWWRVYVRPIKKQSGVEFRRKKKRPAEIRTADRRTPKIRNR